MEIRSLGKLIDKEKQQQNWWINQTRNACVGVNEKTAEVGVESRRKCNF